MVYTYTYILKKKDLGRTEATWRDRIRLIDKLNLKNGYLSKEMSSELIFVTENDFQKWKEGDAVEFVCERRL